MLLLSNAARAQEIVDCELKPAQFEAMQPAHVRLESVKANKLVDVLVADTLDTRAAGFQHVCADTIAQTQLLFVFNRSVNAQFHMHNVKTSLDIAFIDDLGQILSIQTMASYAQKPGVLYSPNVPFRYALEARSGYFAEHGIDTTWRLTLDN